MTDHEEIVRLLHRYSEAIDRLDADGFRDCFVPDAELRALADDVMKLHASFERTIHLVGNHLFELENGRGTGRTYSTVHYIERDGDALTGFTTHAIYLDEVERFDGRWLFATRQWLPSFSTEPQPLVVGAPRVG